MKILRKSEGETKLNKIRSENIRERLKAGEVRRIIETEHI